jgi:hypothetical protein
MSPSQFREGRAGKSAPRTLHTGLLIFLISLSLCLSRASAEVRFLLGRARRCARYLNCGIWLRCCVA